MPPVRAKPSQPHPLVPVLEACWPGLPPHAVSAIVREVSVLAEHWQRVSLSLLGGADALPKLLATIKDEETFGHVLAIVAEWGGERRTIPAHPVQDGHPLEALFGRAAADWVVAHFGGDTLSIPRPDRLLKLARNRTMLEQYEAGMAPSEIARRNNCEHGWVIEILARGHWRAVSERRKAAVGAA